MKWITVVLCVAVLTLGGCESKKAPASDEAKASSSAVDPITVAKDLVTALAAGDVTKASSNFDATMTSAMPASKLSLVWPGLTTQLGTFKGQVGTRTEKAQGYDVVFVTCEFERGRINIQVTIDGSGKVSGLFVRPA